MNTSSTKYTYKTFLLFVLVLIALFHSKNVSAQIFGGNPTSLKWSQISTDSFRIIYPEGLDSSAYDIASLIQFQQRSIVPKYLGDRLRKIDVVLQNQVTFSNGYVGLAPFRSEFYLMPPMDVVGLGAQNWAKNLAIHEYRHVGQYNNFDVGLSHFFKLLFGDNGQALANAASIPDWFFEGDAVYNETLLSRQGRGRLPLFMLPFKQLYLAQKHYNYQKLRNGSYKDYVPNHYNLGYLFVAYGYQKYGIDFWKKVTQDAAAFKGLIYPFQHAVKKFSTKSFRQFKKDAFAFYQRQWSLSKLDSIHYMSSLAKRNVQNYNYVYPIDSGVIALKTDYKYLPSIVKLENNEEQKLLTLPISRDNYFDYKNGKIAYTVYKPDSRWGNKEYSDVEIYDLQTKQKNTISHKQRFFSPAISKDGKKVAVAEYEANQNSALKVLDLKGDIIFNHQAQVNHIYSFPKFIHNDSAIVVVERNKKGEMAIQIFNLISKDEYNILPFANRLISYPLIINDTLFFTCTQRGKDEPWYYSFKQNQFYKAQEFSTDIYQYFIKKDSIIGSTFTADGYRIVKTKTKFIEVKNLYADTLVRINTTTPTPNFSYIFSRDKKLILPITKYRKFNHPFHFHSLQPYIDDPNYSLTLYGENILNTTQTDLAYTYNRVEHYNAFSANFYYGGSYIMPFASIDYKHNRTGSFKSIEKTFRFDDIGTQLGLQLPLNFTSGRFNRNLTISSSINKRWLNYKHLDSIPNKQALYLKSIFTFSNFHPKTVQQITPNFGQLFSWQLRNALDKNKAWQYLAQAQIYLPSVLPTHSFKLSIAYQKQDTLERYRYSSNFPFSRGYNYINFPSMWRYAVDYYFPIAYPDFGFANILYLKRVRGNLFYDISFGKYTLMPKQKFDSYGLELAGDFTIWNQQPISLGIRYSKLLNVNNSNSNRWEIILPINLF